MVQDNSLSFPLEGDVEELVDTLLIEVNPGAEVRDHLCPPPFCGAIGFEHFLLPHHVLFLVVA